MPDWEVFQRDMLDVLRQYERYTDFFERVGSLSDHSRPDCFLRVSRSDKKEVWVLDAKNKPSLEDEDLERMEKYVEMVSSNPIDVGLELSEISEHDVRGIFVTSSGELSPEKFEQVNFSALHQFLQKELVYTDTDRVVRDVAKMMERKQLSQAQARLLFESVKPFGDRLSRVLELLRDIETRYVGLELDEPPLDSYEYSIPVDAVLTHGPREKVFLVDIPYSREALQQVDGKIEEIQERLSQVDKDVYYAAVNSFDTGNDNRYLYGLEEFRDEIQETAAIVSPDELAALFTPKIPVEKEYGDGSIVVRDSADIGFRVEVSTEDDIKHVVEASLPREAASSLRQNFMNSRRDLGELHETGFRQVIEVTGERGVRYSGKVETLESYRDSVRSLFQAAVNPPLAREANQAY